MNSTDRKIQEDIEDLQRNFSRYLQLGRPICLKDAQLTYLLACMNGAMTNIR